MGRTEYFYNICFMKDTDHRKLLSQYSVGITTSLEEAKKILRREATYYFMDGMISGSNLAIIPYYLEEGGIDFEAGDPIVTITGLKAMSLIDELCEGESQPDDAWQKYSGNQVYCCRVNGADVVTTEYPESSEDGQLFSLNI